jgi:hypothetical protein
MTAAQISKKEAVAMLWERGVLYWKLHPIQKKMYDEIISYDREITTITCSRRLGKSFLMCVLAIEKCIQTPDAIIKYICPRQNMVKKIIKPIMKEIFKDCPPELRAEFKTNDNTFLFPNGSQIQLAGTDNGHHESIRGGRSDLWIVDEAGFCQELKYVVNSVLAPTTDTTGGRGILASTPSPEPDHEFISEFVKPAELADQLIIYTIYDNPMMTPEKIQKIINRYPLREKSPEFRREYLCEVIIDSNKAVIPEFTSEIQELCVKEWKRPPFYDAYVSMDIGFNDLTVVLFGYYDFKNAVTVIEDEYFINGPELRTDVLANAITKKEEELYTHPVTGEIKKPYLRIADNNNLILLNDLIHNHDINFLPTKKDNKEAALSDLRLKVSSGKIIINPKCRVLIHHMKNATWNKSRTSYERSPAANVRIDNKSVLYIPEGHYDALDSLIYFNRNVIENKNPYPPGYGLNTQDGYFFSPHRKDENLKKYEKFIEMFKPKSSFKRS